MSKKRETAEIIRNAIANGIITEQEILLLKKRGNAGENLDDLYVEMPCEGIGVTAEQGEKGLQWLRKQSRKRVNNPFGLREQEIVAQATANDFTFTGFYDAGRYSVTNLQPIYSVGSMEYTVIGGECLVLS